MMKNFIPRPLHRLAMLSALVLPALAQGAQEKPNILWITIEDTSEYQFGCYGNKDIETPVLDAMAKRGVLYTNASATAPHCSAARSSLVTGSYATTFGMDVHREDYITPDNIFYPSYLRNAGYFCTNQTKTDYNTQHDDAEFWDECGKNASYMSPKRKEGQPFFAVYNTTATHMGRNRSITLTGRQDFKALGIDPETLSLPAHVPDLPAVRSDEAYQLQASRGADAWLGKFLKDLEKNGHADDTVVFFYSDHGGCLPRGKGFPFESGLSIPLVVYVPEKWQKAWGVTPGTREDRLVDFVDFAPTVFSMLDLPTPGFMQGRAFLGARVQPEAKYQFGFRTNQENYHFDPARTVRDKQFKYIRNYIPNKPYHLRNLYQWGMPANAAWDEYVMSGECKNPVWLQPFEAKPVEMLFDLDADPWEVNNLAGDPKYAAKLQELRGAVSKHIRDSKDLGFFPRNMRGKKNGLYQWVKDEQFPLEALYQAAELASMPSKKDIPALEKLLSNDYAELRYWGAVGFATLAAQGQIDKPSDALLAALDDSDDEVVTFAAEALVFAGDDEVALPKLVELFSANYNPAYSTLETFTWVPEQKAKLKKYVPQLQKLLKQGNPEAESRMDIGVKIRSLLVNLDAMPITELYTPAEIKKGEGVNRKARQFKFNP